MLNDNLGEGALLGDSRKVLPGVMNTSLTLPMAKLVTTDPDPKLVRRGG